MSHQSVRFLLRDVSNSLADNIEFKGGRETEFNNLISSGSNKENYRWLKPMTAVRSNYNNQTRTVTWNIRLLFMKKDNFDANAEQTNTLHDIVDLQVNAYLQRLDDWSQTSQDIVGQISIGNIRQDPFYKDQAGVYSGWEVQLQLTTPDDFLYCTPENIDFYAANI